MDFFEDKGTWMVVFFLDKTSSPVPDFWVRTDEKHCMWPPKKYNTIKQFRALKERQTPEDDWEELSIRDSLTETGKLCYQIINCENL